MNAFPMRMVRPALCDRCKAATIDLYPVRGSGEVCARCVPASLKREPTPVVFELSIRLEEWLGERRAVE